MIINKRQILWKEKHVMWHKQPEPRHHRERAISWPPARMKKNKDPPDSCWRTQSSLCAWFFPPLTCLLGVVSLFDFPIKKSVFLRVKPDICHVWLAYNKMTNPSLQLMKYWLGFLFSQHKRDIFAYSNNHIRCILIA